MDGRMIYYRPDGSPCDIGEWGKLHADFESRVIRQEYAGKHWVSTVWMGIDHSFGQGPPLIFETMVFPSKEDLGEEDCQRYATKEEALAGHRAMVKKWRGADG